ncbi:MAG: N-acyl homoserine lactonase family protein [Chloroflexi bacterium]|nr:MAG: N-acyl homoserine lactonase family protein [Chloroflexota bacterium]TMB79299.1 MAG: N-acyl homoserine lactonase family protein [Chloroflexota bacterium]TMB92031.1 MAG: N-acyl homoserine lactonase family protein [Chloroflexota bacterium]TMC30892.1 MAG: N-acyl homoserine lactonase family protein [Chloroflexota bacterium]TMC34322.1 MAG: N-acyl homoserine lactonase family protein [Chloroflexota bacterium]
MASPLGRSSLARTVIELLLFRTGAVDIARSAFAPWLDGAAREERVLAPVWSALLRTPDGNILFDTGLHPVHVVRPDATFGPGGRGPRSASGASVSGLNVVMKDEDAVVARLAALGVRPDDVAIVVNSHLHFDHAGNNGAFPRATFIAQADHLAFAKGKPNFPGVYWDIPELTYVPVAGRSKVARGVEVVPTPGHAPGHQSLVVDLAETGRVVLTGDAAFTRANLERGEIPAMDQVAAKESLALIRSLANGDVSRIFTSHDADAWATWRHAPDAYR